MGGPAERFRGALALRRDARARLVVRSWRQLTSPRRSGRAHAGAGTLVAVSGGGDSSALGLALASAAGGQRIVFGHVLHDLRPEAESAADMAAARELAERVGAPFVWRAVRVRGSGGNAEGLARRLRYAALVEMARQVGVGFVATGHQADDQLESVLMAVVRGAGAWGAAGVAARRRLGSGVEVVRPMLGLSRAEARGLCRLAGWGWREDASNADAGRLRAALRAQVTPALERIRPGASRRAAVSAGLIGGAARSLRREALGAMRRAAVTEAPDAAAEIGPVGAGTVVGAGVGDSGETGGMGGGVGAAWSRAALRSTPGVVVGEMLRIAARRAGGGGDRLTARAVGAAARAISSQGTQPRVFEWSAVRVRVTAQRVWVEPRRGSRQGA
ncbi:MAG: tRNA lysidine(34) synthetase TilS [Planctomyces sp.]|nr:tRNA lysidine(34) synthetase TilS [Planctomyces sp.]